MKGVCFEEGDDAFVAKAPFCQLLGALYLFYLVADHSLLVNAQHLWDCYFTKEHFNGEEILHFFVLNLLELASIVRGSQSENSVLAQLVGFSDILVRQQKLAEI